MKLFDILNIYNKELKPQNSKIHLAGYNGQENPLDVYLKGEFDEWQRWQTRKNFPRKYVVSLIDLKKDNSWLFSGLHESGEPNYYSDTLLYRYPLKEEISCQELNGRLIVSFTRQGRQSYLNSENWVEELIVRELYSKKIKIGDFSGFNKVDLSYAELKLIVDQKLISWYSALSSVAGIYLISHLDSGKLYVGSATGEGGIWQRWASYVNSGHGGNIELIKLVADNGAENFRYSILEIIDIHTSYEEIIQREIHWKNILMTRSHGLNLN